MDCAGRAVFWAAVLLCMTVPLSSVADSGELGDQEFLLNTATGQYDVTFSYVGGYFSFEVGDVDPHLLFGHGFLTPGSGDGSRIDFWMVPDGSNNVDGSGIEGGGGASTLEANFSVGGGNDTFLGALAIFEDGVDQYLGGAGLDMDSFAFAGNLANFTGFGADGTNCAYGRVFESEAPQVGDWYYVGRCAILYDAATQSNSVPIGRAEGIGGLDSIDGTPFSFRVIATPTTSTIGVTTTSTITSTTTIVPPVIVRMNSSVVVWGVHFPTGMVAPIYATNVTTTPVEWFPVSIFSNSFENNTNVFCFNPPDTNATTVYIQLLQTF